MQIPSWSHLSSADRDFRWSVIPWFRDIKAIYKNYLESTDHRHSMKHFGGEHDCWKYGHWPNYELQMSAVPVWNTPSWDSDALQSLCWHQGTCPNTSSSLFNFQGEGRAIGQKLLSSALLGCRTISGLAVILPYFWENRKPLYDMIATCSINRKLMTSPSGEISYPSSQHGWTGHNPRNVVSLLLLRLMSLLAKLRKTRLSLESQILHPRWKSILIWTLSFPNWIQTRSLKILSLMMICCCEV